MDIGTTNVYFDGCAAVSVVNKDTHYTAGQTFISGDLGLNLLISMSSVPESIKYKEIQEFEFNIYAEQYESAETSADVLISSLASGFDLDSVTFLTSPTSFGSAQNYPIYQENVPGYCSIKPLWNIEAVRAALFYGMKFMSYHAVLQTPNGSNRPYWKLTHGESNVGINASLTYPVGDATISKALDTVFQWSAKPESIYTLFPVETKSTKFRWRYENAESYNEVSLGSQTQYVIPGGTFETGTIEWQVEITANSGTVMTSAWQTTEVREPVSSALPLQPKNSVVDGSSETTFAWEHIIETGTDQTKFDLQISTDDSEWATVCSVSTSETSVAVPADTFLAGDLYWRVRTYNTDGVAGEWSASAHCVVIAAPATPGVTVTDNAPQFAIRWQQAGQQAYEIRLDEKTIAKKFGAESSYQYDDYLEPGTYKIQVRIQNQYSMWSDWGKSSITIENAEGPAISLSASEDNDVQLQWMTSGSYSSFIIYRNGKKIAQTSGLSFTDHFAIGHTNYQVRGIYADSGNYTMSGTVTVNIAVKDMQIADVKDPHWLSLSKSSASLRTTKFYSSQSVTYTSYAGAALPSAEIGEHVSKSYQLDAAWKTSDLDNRKAFEALLGRLVCVKTPYGRRIIGVLNPIDWQENRFISSYSCTITLVDWEEG